MKRWVLVLLTTVALGLGWFFREALFPSEVSRIQQHLIQLASDVSFGPQEGNMAAVRKVSAVTDRFAADASIEVDVLAMGSFHLTGREEIQQALWAARRMARRLHLKFHDIVVQLAEGKQSADVHLTATAEAEGRGRNQEGFDAVEFGFQLRKWEGKWVIQRVSTIQTLKQ